VRFSHERAVNPAFSICEVVPDLSQIAVQGADHLYREIRIDNTLTRENADEVSLKPGAQVEVIVEAEAEATSPKK
jgi:uncharacterized protein YfaS (alpha-2-macroglobulin family)